MHVQLVEAYWPIHWWSKTLWSVKGEANIVDLLLTRLHFKVVRSCIYSLFYVIWGSLTMLVRFHIKKQQFRSDRLFSILFLSLSAERSVFIGGAHSRLASECPLNEWCTYIALYCVLLYTQSASQSCGGGGGLSSTTTSVQHPLGWCDGCHRTTAPVPLPHTSYRWRGERVIEPIKWMGIIRRPWLRRASGGNLARTPGLHPYSLREVPWNFFYDHRESGPRFNVSSERQCFLTV